MDENYLGASETNSLLEIIVVVIFMCLGMFSVQWFCRYMDARVDLHDNYDKVYADVAYEEVEDEVFVFTPYQAYMMGYYMDNWGPDNLNSLTYVNCSLTSRNITISPEIYTGNLVLRNNLISGSNYEGHASVHYVLESIRGNLNIVDYYRGNTEKMIYMSLTDAHSEYEDELGDNGVSVIDRRKKFVWILDQTPHRQILEDARGLL